MSLETILGLGSLRAAACLSGLRAIAPGEILGAGGRSRTAGSKRKHALACRLLTADCLLLRSYDSKRLVTNSIFPGADPARDEANGRLHDARLQPRENVSRSGAETHRAPDLQTDPSRPEREMRWTEYAVAMLLCSASFRWLCST